MRIYSLAVLVALLVACDAVVVVTKTADIPVVVTNTGSRSAGPTLTSFAMSSSTLQVEQSWSASAVVADIPATGCGDPSFRVYLRSPNDPRNYYRGSLSRAYTFTETATGVYNVSSVVPFPASSHLPSGVWTVFVVLLCEQTSQSNSYSALQLAALGAPSSVTLSAAGNTPYAQPWAAVEYLSFQPTTLTSASDVLNMTLRIRYDPLITDDSTQVTVSCSNQPVPFLGGYISAEATISQGGWMNVSSALNANTGAPRWNGWSAGATGAGTQYCTVQIIDSFGVRPQILVQSNYVRNTLRASLTLSGASFSADNIAPVCTFAVTNSPADVTLEPAIVGVTANCDETVSFGIATYVPPAVTPPQFLDGTDGVFRYLGNGLSIAKGAVAGTYTIQSVWVSDIAGNMALYSVSDPPVFSSPSTDFLEGEGAGYAYFINEAYARGDVMNGAARVHVGAAYAAGLALLALACSLLA